MTLSPAEMKRMRRAGFSVQYIADRAGLSRETVGRYLREWGVYPEEPLDLRRLPDWLGPQVQRMYWDEAMSQNEIGAVMGVAGTTVSRWMQSFGIPRRTRGQAQTLRRALNPDLPGPPRGTREEKQRAGRARAEKARADGTMSEMMARIGRRSAEVRRERRRAA